MLTLTAIELRELTGYKRRPEQVRELRRMGIPHHVTGNGKVVVLRSAVGMPKDSDEGPPREQREPDFYAV